MKDAHLVGLHWLSIREHNSTYALFRQLNKDCFTPDGGINLPRIIVSKGSVPMVAITDAMVENGVLTVNFDSRYFGGEPTDEFYLFVYCPAICVGRLATPVPRSAGLVSAVLPDEWLHTDPTAATFPHSDNQGLHLYAFLRGKKGRTSDTIYITLQD